MKGCKLQQKIVRSFRSQVLFAALLSFVSSAGVSIAIAAPAGWKYEKAPIRYTVALGAKPTHAECAGSIRIQHGLGVAEALPPAGGRRC